MGVYKMRVKAKFTPNTAPEGYIYFKLTVLHRCVRNALYPKDPVSVIQYTMRAINPIATNYIIPDWGQKLKDCGDILYKASLSGGTQLPSFLKFKASAKELTI